MQANRIWREGEGALPVHETAATPAVGSRALVPVQANGMTAHYGRTRYPIASFLAHLIAADRRLPQARTRRRAGPCDAAAVYSAALTEKPARTGDRLRHSA